MYMTIQNNLVCFCISLIVFFFLQLTFYDLEEYRSYLAEKEKHIVMPKPCTATHTLSPCGTERESERQNLGKSWVEVNCLIDEARENKRLIHSSPQAGRCSATSREAQLQYMQDKHGSSEYPLFPSPFPADILNMTLYSTEYPFGGSALLCLLPNSCAPPAYVLVG